MAQGRNRSGLLLSEAALSSHQAMDSNSALAGTFGKWSLREAMCYSNTDGGLNPRVTEHYQVRISTQWCCLNGLN